MNIGTEVSFSGSTHRGRCCRKFLPNRGGKDVKEGSKKVASGSSMRGQSSTYWAALAHAETA